jgi:glucose-1-phosphate thymidylyltransferase
MLTGIVPCGGYGSRLRPLIGDAPKALLPVGQRPLVEYALRILRAIGVDLAVLTVSPHTLSVKDVVGDSYEGLPVAYALQDPPRGLLDAVYQARHIARGDCITLLSDEVYLGADHRGLVEHWQARPELDGLVGFVDGALWSAISKNYSIRLAGAPGGQMRVARMVEKPTEQVNALLGTGTWVFGPRFFSYAERVLQAKAAEKRAFVDALQLMIDEGCIIEGYNLGGHYTNINSPADVEAVEVLLSTSAPSTQASY